MGNTVGNHYMNSFTILHEIVFLWHQRLKQTNTNKKSKTLLNSATAVKQSNHHQEVQTARQAILTGHFPPHSYSTPTLMAWAEDGKCDLNFLVVVSLSHNLNAI